MDVEEEEVAPIRVEDYNWVPSRSTTKTKIKQRIKYLKTSRWCPKEGCHKMCVMVSGGKSKVVNGHCESSRTSGGSSYPDCGEQGEVSRNDVHKWTNKFRASRKIDQLELFLKKRDVKKKKK